MHSRRISVTATALVSALPGLALAQAAGSDRSQSFQAVEGAVEEDVPGGPLVVAAYGIIWVLLLLYVVRLTRLQQRTQADVERLTGLLEGKPSGDGRG